MLVAAQAQEISARTGGYILLQLIFDLSRAGGHADRLLDGPTSEVWIDPWVAHLRGAGVDLRTDTEVDGIDCALGRIAGVTVDHHGTRETVTADHYVAAMPVEQLRPLLSAELVRAEPRLDGTRRLRTRWMNGVMFYLHRDVPILAGHTIYSDSDWALTSISQRQFWPRTDFADLGDGHVGGILSVDVSDWERPSRRTGKVASKCSADEIKAEVWAQLKDHLNDPGHVVLEDANLASAFLDEDITFPNPSATANAEPLLINTAGSWADRPEAVTRVPNLFLASDFVRTLHRPGHDGGRQRGRAARGQRHPRRHALERQALRRVEARRAGALRPGAAAGPRALEARPPAGQAAAAGDRRRRARAGWAGRAPDAALGARGP